MTGRRRIVVAFLALASLTLLNCASAAAQQASNGGPTAESQRQRLLDEGENKFHANCGRCHQPPHKLAPRVVLTVERHMRVRATLTDEDVRAIVAYLTQ